MTKEQIQALIDSAISGQGNQIDLGGVLPNIFNGIMELADEKFSVLESELGINLDPDLDEKYYKPFTLEAKEDGTTVYFRQSSYASDDGLDALKVEVSTDDGETWEEKTASVAEDDVPGTVIATLDAGEKVLIRGTNKAYGYYSADNDDAIENCNFYADSPCYVYGNIMSLVGGDDFARLIKVEDNAFACFFNDYDGVLDWSWVLSKEGRELLLPATTLAQNCYNGMFYGCTGLTKAPALPATILSEFCYASMFIGCTGLMDAPALPATTLALYCYNNMFNGCTSLTEAPALPAITLAQNCYNGMFYGCTKLAKVTCLATDISATDATDFWLYDVAATGTFTKAAGVNWTTGDSGIPSGWTVEEAA